MRLIICLLLLSNAVNVFAQPSDLNSIIKQAGNPNPQIKVKALCNYAYYLYQNTDEPAKADSIANTAITESRIAEKNDLFIEACICYARVCEGSKSAKALENLKTATDIAIKQKNKQLQFDLLVLTSDFLYEKARFAEAKKYIEEATKIISHSKENEIIQRMMTSKIQFQNNEKLNAFENINNAILLCNEIENDSLLLRAKFVLAKFYFTSGDNSKMKDELDDILKMMESGKEFSMADKMEYKGNLISYYSRQGDYEIASKIFDEAVAFCNSNNLLKIKNDLFNNYRSGLMATDQYKVICDLYCTKYPEELQKLKKKNNTTYNRLQALIFENFGEVDSAKYYLGLAESEIINSTNTAYTAVFFKRKGQFFLRQKENDQAIHAFLSYYDLAVKSAFYPYIIDAAALLDSLYAQKGNIQEAYKFAKLKSLYIDSNSTELQKDKLLKIELENSSKIQALEKEKEESHATKRSNFQVLIIITVIISLLIFLIIVSKYKVSVALLKFFSYITFILFFELIIYFLDTYIHHLAHGQPIIILAIKVVIIGIILPIHHAVDYRFFKFLSNRKQLNNQHETLWQWIRAKWGGLQRWLNTHEDHKGTAEEAENTGH